MNKKYFLALLATLILLMLGGCAKSAANSRQELVYTGSSTVESIHQDLSAPRSTEEGTTDCRHVDLVLNDRHYIQADVEGGQYIHLNSFVLEPLSVSVEESFCVFAPEDTSSYSVQKTEEGFRLISQAGNRCYVSPYRIMYEKENEIQKKINNEILNLLSLYAEENPETSWNELDFIDQARAIQMVEEYLKKIGVNLEPVLQTCAAMPAQEIINYQQELFKRDQTSEERYYDPFDTVYLLDNLDQKSDACFLSFTFTYQGIPIYKGTPTVSYIPGVLPPHPVTLSVLITRQGLQIFNGMGLYHVGKGHYSSDILSAEEAIDIYRQKYDLVIHPEGDDMRVSRIYLEYIPIVLDTGTILTPYWCFPIEVDYPVGWYVVDSERFNAFTGEDIAYGG